jgi:hypothetical protein
MSTKPKTTIRISLLIFAAFNLLITASTFAGSEIYRPLSERVKASDAIVVGSISSVESYNTYKSVTALEDINIYSVVTIENASTIESFGIAPIDGMVKLIVSGGVIPMPEVLKSKYQANYVVQGDTSMPSLPISPDTTRIFFISGNGQNDVPFASISHSVLIVRDDGQVLSNAGGSLAKISNDDFRMIRSNNFARPDYAEGPNPPDDILTKDKKAEPLSFNELVKYIGKYTMKNRDIMGLHEALRNPSVENPSFGAVK